MPSHPVKRLASAGPAENGAREVTFVLACGCEVRRSVPEDRVVEAVDGRLLLVGKYPCPNRHPIKRTDG